MQADHGRFDSDRVHHLRAVVQLGVNAWLGARRSLVRIQPARPTNMTKSSFVDHELKPLARSIAATHFARAIMRAKPTDPYYRVLTLPMYWEWEEMLIDLLPGKYEENIKFIGVDRDKNARDSADRCKLRDHDLMIPTAMDVYDFLVNWVPKSDRLDGIFIDACGSVGKKGLEAIQHLPKWLVSRHHVPFAITMATRASGTWKDYLDANPIYTGSTYYEKAMSAVARGVSGAFNGTRELKWDRPFTYRPGLGGVSMALACGTIISHRAPDAGDYDIDEL